MNVPFYWTAIKAEWIFSDISRRLDASFYSKDIVEARILLDKMKKNGIPIITLNDPTLTSKIFWPERFKRKYVRKNKGKPFLLPKEVFQFLPQPRKFIVDPPQDLLVKEKWILVTRSGSIGRTLLSNKILSNFLVSDDLIRIIPKDEEKIGYIYAFLNTWIGQAFLTKTPYGQTVKHIEPEHVGNIPIPLLPESDMEEINEKILEAHKLREEAQKLLLKAKELFYEELGIPLLNEDKIEYFGGEKGKNVKAFIAKASELNFRLDASYHIPIIKFLIKQMNDNSNGYLTNLGNLVEKIFIPTRFKRIYVKNRKQGIPFLQGSHVPMVKLFDVKYLWKKSKNLENIVLKKNWILMTRSGTVGKVALVTDYWNEWAGSEHILRIIPSTSVHPGYILTFLLSAYGQFQIKGKVYGGVVNEIAEQDVSLINKIKILVPYDDKIQNKIGNLITEAYEKKDQANMIENEAIKLLEEKLEECVK